MELKRVWTVDENNLTDSINRTFMELKRGDL